MPHGVHLLLMTQHACYCRRSPFDPGSGGSGIRGRFFLFFGEVSSLVGYKVNKSCRYEIFLARGEDGD
jgi:hypothetical protein